MLFDITVAVTRILGFYDLAGKDVPQSGMDLPVPAVNKVLGASTAEGLTDGREGREPNLDRHRDPNLSAPFHCAILESSN